MDYKINRMDFSTSYKILPVTYDESMSYLEKLHCIHHKINEILDLFNTLEDKWEEYTDLKINELKNHSDNEDKKIIDTINKLNYDLLDVIQKKYDIIVDLVGATDDNNRLWTQNKFNELKKLIDNLEIGNIFLYNPTTGRKESITKVTSDIYEKLRYMGLYAYKFDNLELTCKQLDNMNMTAFDYDLFGGKLLKKLLDLFMINPFTGKIDYYQDVIRYLADFHREKSITAIQYDNLNLSCIDYDNKKITSYNYDNLGYSILMGE